MEIPSANSKLSLAADNLVGKDERKRFFRSSFVRMPIRFTFFNREQRMKQGALEARCLAAVMTVAMAFNMMGCGGSAPAPTKSSETAQALSGKDEIKQRLKMIAETGSGGSAVSGMRAGLDKMKATEAPLAEDLLKDVEALEKLQDPAMVKALATEMLNKINK